jgi:Protein of unknown function (DUF3540)
MKENLMYQEATQVKPESFLIQAVGAVLALTPDGFIVSTQDGIFQARHTLSCIVEPAVGDRVLVAGDPGNALFIIAVLERPGNAPISIVMRRDVTVGVSNGSFSIAAAQGINLVSAKDMTLTSSELKISAPRASIFFENLTYLGNAIFAEIEKMKLIGRFFHSMIDSISQKVKRSYRVVEDIDHVRSSQIDYRASKNMSLRGQNALINAEELVKIDGDQIHLG